MFSRRNVLAVAAAGTVAGAAPNADEWQNYIKGKARMTVFNTGPNAMTMDFNAGDIGYVRRAVQLAFAYVEAQHLRSRHRYGEAVERLGRARARMSPRRTARASRASVGRCAAPG